MKTPDTVYFINKLLICEVNSGIHLQQLSRLVCRYTGINNLLNVTVHNLIKLIKRKIDSVVRHSSLREVVGTDLLRSVTRSDLTSSKVCLSVMSLLKLHVIQLGTKQGKSLVLILKLALLSL